jgi:hypothetical protein
MALAVDADDPSVTEHGLGTTQDLHDPIANAFESFHGTAG